MSIILFVCKDSVQWQLQRAKDGKDETNVRRNIKGSGGNHKQVRHFTWGKHKAILAGFKSRGCFGGEEDHQAMGDPGPNPTSLQLILDKSLSSLITICHFLPSQAKEEEHTKTA